MQAELIVSAFAALLYWIYLSLVPPATFDHSVPVVPIWVSFLPLIRKTLGKPPLAQDVIFARFIEPRLQRKGVVAIFFGGCWNLLFSHPDGVRQIFRGNSSDDDVIAKSGNHRKIPDAVISQLTGSNIISEHGELYQNFRKVIGPLLRGEVDFASLNDSSRRFRAVLEQEMEQIVSVNPIIQRFTMDCVCRAIFGVDLQFLRDPPPALHVVQSQVKFHIFQPFALAFPRFDHPRWAWMFPNRSDARNAVRGLEKEVQSVLLAESNKPQAGAISLAMQEALQSGQWTSRNFIDNSKILFIAGHENTQNALNSILMLLAKHQSIQDQVRAEARSVFADAPLEVNKQHLIEQLPLMVSCIYETLRLFPPIPQLLNRRVTRPTVVRLNDDGQTHAISIAAGTYVGWHAYGLHRSQRSSIWQPDAAVFRPGRWGSTVKEIQALARRAESRGQYIPFAAGIRACSGQKLAMAELITALVHILHTFELELPPGPAPSMTPGGLLSPLNLRLVVKLAQTH